MNPRVAGAADAVPRVLRLCRRRLWLQINFACSFGQSRNKRSARKLAAIERRGRRRTERAISSGSLGERPPVTPGVGEEDFLFALASEHSTSAAASAQFSKASEAEKRRESAQKRADWREK
ncbi:hypothetical protein HPB50_005123 [Hyalomma asiaticum]|uniref:Uncharacterized protein n=1 Tax=Hyalomma asiaticum TaxID=266040 RepID=A0ACB7TCP5_HYAAI|nr:hypothetical protein HPB50_005123 [Hyalomma asiaticum]